MTGALLTSCSDDDNSYDVKGSRDNLAYFEAQALNTPYESTITVTPAGAMGAVGDVMKVYFQKPVSKDTRVSVKSNPEAAQKYLDDNDLDYTLIPEDFFDYELATAVVASGKSQSEDGLMVKVKGNKIEDLGDPEVDRWFAAFSIDEVVGDGKSSTSRNTFYALVNTDIQDALHVVNGDVTSCAVVNTPVGIMGGVNVDQPYKFSGALNNDATITLTKDNSLISQYNETYGAEAVALADGLLDITNNTVTVSAGKAESNENFQMSIAESKLGQIPVGTYVVPFRISVTKADGTTVDNAGVYYLVVRSVTSSINDDATGVEGTAIDLSDVTCIAADNLDPDAFSDSGWSFLQKQGTASFTLDLGETKNITGFSVYSYALISNYDMYISSDGTNWTLLGNSAEHTAVNVRVGWYNIPTYVLYGAMPARYIKCDLNLNLNSYYWNYIQWGYCTIDQLTLYAQ